MLHILYRISDGGNLKNKLPHANKMYCLKNCINTFGHDNFYLFADNCQKETLKELKKLNVQLYQTSLGNAGSWRHISRFALDNFKPNQFVYLIEDDYLHLPDAKQVLEEGLEISDYVSLYDHPDKYLDITAGGNPLGSEGGEDSKVLLTNSSHWKTTNSTTMTFATNIETLNKDYPIWLKFTNGKTPKDFKAFSKICGHSSLKNKLFSPKRRLISCIPSRATHIELNYLAPLINWQKV